MTQYALGVRRLEEQEAEEQKMADATTNGVLEPVSSQVRSRRVLLKLQYAANRAKWISATECALYVHTEQQHWTSHYEVPMFISRPLYMISECKRILSNDYLTLTRPDIST